MFSIGDEVRADDIAKFMGYKNYRSLQGGIFSKNGNIILLDKNSTTGKYSNFWDPHRRGTLHFYASPKGFTKGKEINTETGTNKDFKYGLYPIHVFSELHNGTYRYMGEFERNLNQERFVGNVNGRMIDRFEVVSKNYDAIKIYLNDTLEKRSHSESWNDSDIDAFASIYEDGMDDPDQIHQLACIVGKTSNEIMNVIESLKNETCNDEIPNKIKNKQRDLIKTEELIIDEAGYNKILPVSTRVGQKIFRHNLDVVFNGKCCLTGISERKLIRASHIIPWSESDPYTKTDPRNGLLLNGFHDVLFDKHLMTVYHDGDVEYSDSLKENLGSIYSKMCTSYKHIDWPEGHQPSKSALNIHNKKFVNLSIALNDGKNAFSPD